MVLGSLLKNILPIAVVGLGISFLYNVLTKPAQAQESADVITSFSSGIGDSLGSIGQGAQSLLTGIGTGSAQLLNPLFSLKTLFFDEGSETKVLVTEQSRDESNVTMNNPVPNSPSASAGTSATPAQGTTTSSSNMSSYGSAGQHGYAHSTTSVGRFLS